MGSPLKFILLNYLLVFDLLLVVSCVLCVHGLSELWFTLTFLSDLICIRALEKPFVIIYVLNCSKWTKGVLVGSIALIINPLKIIRD